MQNLEKLITDEKTLELFKSLKSISDESSNKEEEKIVMKMIEYGL